MDIINNFMQKLRKFIRTKLHKLHFPSLYKLIISGKIQHLTVINLNLNEWEARNTNVIQNKL